MRQLTEEEVKLVFEKLSKFVGTNLMQIVDNQEDPHVFRLHHDRVFYMSEKVLKMAGCIPRKSLLLAGVCLGKFTKSRKFRLQVTALDLIARYAKYRIWVKPGGEQSYVYGNHVIKRHIGRITADMPQNAGVCICSLNNDLPLGFGVAARATQDIHAADTEAIAVYHVADVGEYLREEADLV
ncbi:putative 60S ribosome subunit biogenesis protein NIP7 [Neospora caninum Liverpool]|uniref:60S ribosome subunit biogenesis protein NIP7 homolog n=1 Tax=Neospora caninum (strain Liverpool) TaxID=572307 RepID=F0VJ66_NEOCL|nr:putative 60S ribosome subunit biogenesis protein NIP7 [Neospora caninum Liverpool]CBZ53777.1 putative 60S ribosome subunit biogenesis protein NIP7 [Neospora caninum Liverpool]CEL67770.1 TPA: 60S ribosome subunit biogenesis protein NIP7,putative [Neospora caninum Liverpool]|eukprot:XP_003883809.1 putative 60S ribosome subunit biogenesis protein NIP7 [Neospora caninum Liverpool]